MTGHTNEDSHLLNFSVRTIGIISRLCVKKVVNHPFVKHKKCLGECRVPYKRWCPKIFFQTCNKSGEFKLLYLAITVSVRVEK